MQIFILLKYIRCIYLAKIDIKNNLHANKNKILLNTQVNNLSQSTSGFTLIEMLAVVIIIGILSAIAAPSWLAFTNRQRVNKVYDTIFSAIQETQREAKNQKLNQSIWFRDASNKLEYAIVPADVTVANITTWKSLGEDVGVNSKQVVLLTNLTTDNTAGTASSANFTTAKRITFDYRGTLPTANFGTPPSGSNDPPGLRVVVAVPLSPNSTQPSSTRRCVIIQNLLGGMRSERDNKCN